MRKLALLVAVALVVTFAAPVMAKQIFTQRHEMLSVLASFGDEEGGASFSKGILAEPFEIGYDADWDCAGLGDDDYESVSIHGEGTVYELTVPTKGKDRFTVGRASATFDWGKFDWQKCDATTGSQDLHGKGITIDMESTGGRLSREREVESWREPDGSRHRLTERHVNRTAIGDVVVEGVWSWEDVDGRFGQTRSVHRVWK